MDIGLFGLELIGIFLLFLFIWWIFNEIILGDKFETMKKKGNLPAELWELFDEQSKSNQN